MHADELDVDVRLVRRLLAEQFPEWGGLPLEPVLPLGTDNANFRLGDELLVRLPRRPRTSVTLEKERRWLPRLAPHLPFVVPAPLADGAATAGYPFAWAVYNWLPGENATVGHVADRGQLAGDLAELIGALWEIDPSDGPPPGEHNFFRGEPLVRRDKTMRAGLAALAGELDTEAAATLWDDALAAEEWPHAPVWIHGDLDARNLLVTDGRLSAVIDWGSAGVGDPACDVMVAWKLLPPDARSAFRAALGVDDATWRRGRGWAVSQAVGALAYYTEETNAVLVAEARRWLAEVLTDYG
jgi:aminoglycoside phosphotransferase (APT) family kinase protein